MRSEQIDKKVQEAAEKHHPAYDEKAWQKMEKLLNEHLPVKEDNRRRVFLLLLLFLLIGGGSLLLLSKPWNKNAEFAGGPEGNNERLVSEKKPQPENTSVPGTQAKPSTSLEQNAPSSKTVTTDLQIQDKQSIPQSVNTRRQDFTRTAPKPTTPAEKNLASKAQTAENNISANNVDQSQPNGPIKEASANPNSIAEKKDENVKQDVVTTNVATKDVAPQNTQAQTAKPPIHKEKSNWLSGFAFLLSAGPDVSKAGGSNLGKLTLAYGAGISYTKSRFTLRAGVYAGRKIYKANASDYELSWQPSNLKFEGADANCYVIEIPVGLYYNFAFGKKSNWFAGAGLSSYLMKSETYNYQFKTSTGTYYNWKYQYNNENKHYFSVLDLSGGYSLHLNNTISLSAEPYLKVPLTGIGAGKVDLKGGGVLFTLGIKPFK